MPRMIVTRIDEIERALTATLEREQCAVDAGCSALANVLLTALVKCKKDPRVARNVSDEMRRLSAKLLDLAAAEDDALVKILSDAKIH